MTEEDAKMICDMIRQTAYSIHLYLGVGYLKATGMRHGLLINFGSEKFECRKVAGRQ